MIRILVVNSKKDANFIWYALKQWGYAVDIVETLNECQEILCTTAFNIVFIRLEPAKELPLILRTIKETHPYLPLIGLTALSRHKLEAFLDRENISRNDFINILHQPFELEELVFTIEEIISQYQEKLIEEEKPLTKKERQQRLTARRRPLEDQRLSDFLSAHTAQDMF